MSISPVNQTKAPSTQGDETVSLGKSGNKFIAQTTYNFLTIAPDTLFVRSRLVKALVPTQPAPSLAPPKVEYPFAELRYPKYTSPSLRARIPAIGLMQQAKIVMPSRTLSTAALLATQNVVQKRLGDSEASKSVSWGIGVLAESAINVPQCTMKYQIQTKQAKTLQEARQQIIAQNGLKGFYKPYGIYAFSRTAVNIVFNQVSPAVTSYIDQGCSNLPAGSRLLNPFVSGAASGILVLPLSQFSQNVFLEQINQHDKRHVLTIMNDLVKKGPSEMWKGWQYGAKRIAFVGAVYNGIIHFLDKSPITIKKKDVESAKSGALSLIPFAGDTAIGVQGSEKLVSQGVSRVLSGAASLAKGFVADVNAIGRDPTIDGT
jgi:hypothetical protein